MGSMVGGLFGGGGGGFKATGADIQRATTPEQARQAWENSQAALTGTSNLSNQIAAMNGAQNQQATADMLRRMATGEGGPNVGQNMLNQATGANVANQAALMAGQRGAAANPGLMARLAAQQGAGIQQQAVGQGATMGAQNQLSAIGQLGQLGTQQTQQQLAAQQAYNQAAQGQQQNILNAIQGQNAAAVQNQAGMNSANAQMAAAQGQAAGGMLGGLGSAMSGPLGNLAGDAWSGLTGLFSSGGGLAMVGENVGGLLAGGGAALSSGGAAAGAGVMEAAPYAVMLANKGGMIPGHLDHVAKVYGYSTGGMAQPDLNGEQYANQMKPVPGKAKVSGDSVKNDTVPALLSPGELIIPKSVMESEDPIKEGTKFLVEALKKNGKAGSEESDFKKALKAAATRK